MIILGSRLRPFVIITHRDLDGVASASLYIYCKNLSEDMYRVIFIEPNKILDVFRKYYKKNRNYVIIDIGLNNNIYQELKHIDLSEVHIEWYDHHVWEDEWIKTLKAKNVEIYVDRSVCATGVVAKNVCRNCMDSSSINDFVESVCGADLWKFNRYESAFLFRYADAKNTNEWRYNVLKTFTNYLRNRDHDLLSIVKEEVVRYVDEELRVLSNLDREIVKFVIDGITLCVYMKREHIPSSSIIGNTLLSRCDIAAIINESLKSISFRSSRCNVRELAKIFNGGGHIKAAGAPLEVSPVYKVLKNIGIGNSIVRGNIVNNLLDKIAKNIDWRKLCVSD
ncbi:MAG: hypothetical protein QW101_03980 [Ignisphaera sp.]|uniref:DHHA1 domain-containing protein n=1 Tax=Ignisphaera aggregans TaxID=334771 RepID=A0A7J3N0P5_9CREN